MKNFINKIYNWISVDGLLHLLVSTLIVIIFTPIIKLWISMIISMSVGILKEVYDLIKKSHSKELIIHDLVCDVLGIFIGLIIVLFWSIL